MGKSPENFDEWIPKAQFAQELNISEKTVERLVAQGHIRSSYRRVPGRRSMVILHPDDCAKMRDESLRPQPIPANSPTPKRQKKTLIPQPLQAKVFLDLQEASAYSGLPEGLLKDLIRRGQLWAIKRGRYFLKREALEDLQPESFIQSGLIGLPSPNPKRILEAPQYHPNGAAEEESGQSLDR